jgi:uridylate kinase
MRIVVRIGGSIVGFPPNPAIIKGYIDLLIDLKKQGFEIITVVGGGSLARDFIGIAAGLGLEEKFRDWIAIHVSRLFARLFVYGLGDLSCGDVIIGLDEAKNCLEEGKIVVMGGLRPGMTTDTVAALVGEKVKADLLIKGSNVEGVFDKDPKKFFNAVKLEKISFDELSSFFEVKNHKAGINQIIDPEAVKVLQRCKLRTFVVNGFKVENILSAIKGEKIGTIIE